MWNFRCPNCQSDMSTSDSDVLHCSNCGSRSLKTDGIWRLLTPEQQQHYQQFITDYETVRGGEGRANVDAKWYRALPFLQPEQPFYTDWRIRAVSYQSLIKHVFPPTSLHVVDLGAGNGWLSHRLAERGHTAAAVDVLDNDWDGLGAQENYDQAFTTIQASFECIPLTDNQADVVIYNGAFHYATDYRESLCEAKRVLRDNGVIVIMDTPVYSSESSGAQMVQEREAHFEKTHGTRSNALPFQNYLTYELLESLAQQCNLTWQIITPFYGFQWMLRPLKARLRGHREPARFHLIVGRQH